MFQFNNLIYFYNVYEKLNFIHPMSLSSASVIILPTSVVSPRDNFSIWCISMITFLSSSFSGLIISLPEDQSPKLTIPLFAFFCSFVSLLQLDYYFKDIWRKIPNFFKTCIFRYWKRNSNNIWHLIFHQYSTICISLSVGKSLFQIQ